MREVVQCLNCRIKWVRVTPQYDGVTIELTESLMYNCPNCNSNYYERVAVLEWDDKSGKPVEA